MIMSKWRVHQLRPAHCPDRNPPNHVRAFLGVSQFLGLSVGVASQLCRDTQKLAWAKCRPGGSGGGTEVRLGVPRCWGRTLLSGPPKLADEHTEKLERARGIQHVEEPPETPDRAQEAADPEGDLVLR